MSKPKTSIEKGDVVLIELLRITRNIPYALDSRFNHYYNKAKKLIENEKRKILLSKKR